MFPDSPHFFIRMDGFILQHSAPKLLIYTCSQINVEIFRSLLSKLIPTR